jgi:hypothetical protein
MRRHFQKERRERRHSAEANQSAPLLGQRFAGLVSRQERKKHTSQTKSETDCGVVAAVFP